jgi:hypothetical protein
MTLLAAVCLATLLTAAAEARGPRWGGLGGVAASPDGKTVVTAGDNRTLYVLDAATLEVKQRAYFGYRIGALAYSKDGSTLVVETDDGFGGSIRFLDPAGFKEKSPAIKGERLTTARTADLGVAVGGKFKAYEVVVFSLQDGSVKAKIPYADAVGSAALNADGTKLYVLGADKDVTNEKKVPYNMIPKDLKDLARDEFVQKNDGRGSTLTVYEIPSGKQLAKHELFYTAGSDPALLAAGDTLYVLTYSNVNAKIGTADGATEVFKKAGGGYAIAVSPDHKQFLNAGMVGFAGNEGNLGTVEGLKMTVFGIEKIPGFPEYYGAFTFADDGSMYAATTAYRLIKLSKAGTVEKVVPVY